MKKKEVVFYDSDLHFEHQLWFSELAFWEDELRSFKNRLQEMVTRFMDKEMLVQLEHFQNEFVLHGGVIDDLRETIEKHEANIAGNSKMGQEAMDVVLMKKHLEFRHSMETQRDIYANLKRKFFKFLTDYY